MTSLVIERGPDGVGHEITAIVPAVEADTHQLSAKAMEELQMSYTGGIEVVVTKEATTFTLRLDGPIGAEVIARFALDLATHLGIDMPRIDQP